MSSGDRTRRVCAMHEQLDGRWNPECPSCRGEIRTSDRNSADGEKADVDRRGKTARSARLEAIK